ncbi:MAG TPA: hypothetical protein VHW23_23720, partial [Kofleriaceae bacterium]|nr:hypothetical protein [Kofleriaceae bacterium]
MRGVCAHGRGRCRIAVDCRCTRTDPRRSTPRWQDLLDRDALDAMARRLLWTLSMKEEREMVNRNLLDSELSLVPV